MSDQVSNKLERIQAELGEIVDERIQALEAVLQNAERMTRRLIKAEMELEHLSGNETELTLQASTLEDQVAAARSRNAEIEATHQRLLAERDQLAARRERWQKNRRSCAAPSRLCVRKSSRRRRMQAACATRTLPCERRPRRSKKT